MRVAFHPALVAGLMLGVLTSVGTARGADIGGGGKLAFAKDALATHGFETFASLQAAGAATLVWRSGSAGDTFDTKPLSENDEGVIPTDVSGALEGSHALVVGSRGATLGLALRDVKTLGAQLGNRIEVSMWGRAFGAEPALEVVYSRTASFGPRDAHVVAIRTGRETSDGWVEYSTGPIDGSVWGAGIQAIVLTARYLTGHSNARMLVDGAFGPSHEDDRPTLLDPEGYAVIDAVEIRPAAGSVTPPNACNPLTVDTACGANGECQFGHCLDAAVVWGPVPQAAGDRADRIARWAFQAQSLLSDRQAVATAMETFSDVVPALSAETSPRRYYGKLNQLVNGLRNSHTELGSPSSYGSVFQPLVYGGYGQSGPLDVCLGVAENDLGAGETMFAVFAVGDSPSTDKVLAEGDVLTSVDGLSPTDWLDVVASRFTDTQPPDPAADPMYRALILSNLLGRYATSVTFSRCQSAGASSACAPLPPILIADAVYQLIRSTGTFKGDTISCSPRFLPAVAMPPDDEATYDVPVVEAPVATGGITTVQLDGFLSDYDPYSSDPWGSWEDPMTSAFQGGSRVLVDARLGHGGYLDLAVWLFRLLRGTDQPYGMFAAPRGAYDDLDPAWILSAKVGDCQAGDYGVGPCGWLGNASAFTTDASPDGEPSKIAWLNGDDVSANDIAPRLLQGRKAFRVFGPHPTQGAYGELSYLPPIDSSWTVGTLQAFDTRFGATLAEAQAARWESGHGAIPDQVVLQKVSDILAHQDTVLAAARAWLAQ